MSGFIGAISSVFQGVSANKAAKEQAAQYERQAAIAANEAEIEAGRQGEARRKFIAEQKVAFLANGVGISGTPLKVFEDTYYQYQQEIDATRRQGAAQSDALRWQAGASRRAGRAALIGGVLQAGEKLAKQGEQAAMMGVR